MKQEYCELEMNECQEPEGYYYANGEEVQDPDLKKVLGMLIFSMVNWYGFMNSLRKKK